jgi:hypothetical protein
VPVKVRQPRVTFTKDQLRERKRIHYYEHDRELSVARRRQVRIETRAAVEVAIQLGIATDDVKYPVIPEGEDNRKRTISQLNKELWQYMVDANLPLTTSEMTELFAMVKHKSHKRTKEQNERRRERERKRGIIRDALKDEGLLDSLGIRSHNG